MKYKINPSATLLSKEESCNKHTIQFILDGSRCLHRFSVSTIGKEILICLYDKVSVNQLKKKFNVSKEEITQFLEPLVRSGLVFKEEDIIASNSFGQRNVRTVEFFQSFFTQENSTKQMVNKLLNSSILVIGLGGVGSWVVEMIARMGIKRMILIDNDIIEYSNIPRQAMFSINDIGQHKVFVAKNYVESVSENIDVIAVSKKIKKASDLFLYTSEVDLVINCADKPDVDTTNALVTSACFMKKTVPHILCGGYDGHLSFLGQTVIPHKSSCWFCYVDSGIYESVLDGYEIIERKSNDRVGGTICPIGVQIASLQVQEAVRVITGCTQPVMLNRKAEIDFLNLSCNFTEIPKLKHCKNCKR